MGNKTWKNLEKRINRQRLVIEGKYRGSLRAAKLRNFLKDLSEHLGATIVYGPIVKNLAGKINPVHGGYESVVIWVESGAQLYAWGDFNFFTLDIYSCKKFNVKSAVTFTAKYLNAVEVAWKEV